MTYNYFGSPWLQCIARCFGNIKLWKIQGFVLSLIYNYAVADILHEPLLRTGKAQFISL